MANEDTSRRKNLNSPILRGSEKNSIESNTGLEKWKVQRRRTFLAFCLIISINGLECGIALPTLFTYLKENLKTPHLNIWYGLIASSYFITSNIGCLTVSRYADQTKNIRLVLIATCLFVSLGNLIYATSKYAFVLLIGRLMQGFGDSLVSTLSGETMRIYRKEEVVPKISTFMTAFFVSYIISPILITICGPVNFELYAGVRLEDDNFPFIIVGFLWLLGSVLSYFVVCDLSKNNSLVQNECDIQDGRRRGETESEIQSNVEQANDKMLPLRKLIFNRDLAFIYSITFVVNYFSGVFNAIYVPIIANRFYEIALKYVGMIYTMNAVFFSLTMYLVTKLNYFNNEIYFIVFGSSAMVIALQAMTMSVIMTQFHLFGILMLITFAICTGVGWSVEQVLLTALSGKFVPLNMQSYAAGVRRTVGNTAHIIGEFLAPNLQDCMAEHCLVISVVYFGFIGYAIIYRRRFTTAKMIGYRT
ncbi:uncharacterized protein [Clytia hemisphaerica]